MSPIIRIRAFLRGTYKSRFVRNVAVVGSGTAGAQAITMAFAPVISRLYSPEAFGLLGTFTAVVAMITPIAALSYPIAIVLPREDSVAKGIARLSAYISLAMAMVVALFLLTGRHKLLGLLQVEAIAAFVLLIPLNILFAAWLEIAQQWLIRKNLFHIKAKAAVAQALLVNSAMTGIGWFNPVAAVLIVLSTIGSALHAALLYFGLSQAKQEKLQESDSQPGESLLALAKRHYDFPLYRAPQVFINAISQSLPVLMLASFFGPASAGFYVLCKRLLEMPSALIGKSVGDVFYSRITEAAHRGENLTRLIVKATLALAVIGFLPFAIVIAYGPWLFGVVFGAEWVVAGEYARWLALMMFFFFINKPAIAAVPVMGLQRTLIIYEIFSTGTKILALYIGFVLFMDDVLGVAFFSIVGMIAYIFLIVWVIFSSKKFLSSTNIGHA